MIKSFLIIILLFVSLYAVDSLTAQKQNALYIQNMIDTEENIAKNFEKYLLTEFKFPTDIDILRTDDYLGSNFSVSNKMGSDISIESATNLKIKYAVTKDEYRKKSNSSVSENYMVQLYNRDLYREFTSVYDDSSSISNSYVQIILQSDEAKTIYDILKNGDSIQKECNSSLTNTYCNNKNNIKTFRWYNNSSKWIEYDKDKFNKGDISTSMSLNELLLESKISNLSVGSYIFISSDRYVKLPNDGSTIQVLKVD